MAVGFSHSDLVVMLPCCCPSPSCRHMAPPGSPQEPPAPPRSPQDAGGVTTAVMGFQSCFLWQCWRAQKYQTPQERCETLQGVGVPAGRGLQQWELNPILEPREAPAGLCDDNPQEKPGCNHPAQHEQPSLGVVVMPRSARAVPPVPARPGSHRIILGAIYSFSSEFAQIFPMAKALSLPLHLNLGVGLGSQEEHHQLRQLGGQMYPKSTLFCLLMCWIFLIIHHPKPSGARDAPGTGCLLLPSSLHSHFGGPCGGG